MSRILYDFLQESFLFNEEDLRSAYSRFSQPELARELARYRRHVERHESDLLGAIASREDQLSIYFDSSARTTPLALLKQAALFYDHAIVDDPLFQLTAPKTILDEGLSKTLNYQDSTVEGKDIASAISIMREATPMVAGGFLSFAPFNKAREIPENPPLQYSGNLFAEKLPDPLRVWMQKRVRVSPMEKLPDIGWRSYPGRQLHPCRGICIEFEGYPQPYVYHLFEWDIRILDEASRKATGALILPEAPPEPAMFDGWVRQSINQAAFNVLDRARDDIQKAEEYSSTLFTRSDLVADFRRLTLAPERQVDARIADLSFRLELPLIEHASVRAIMDVRNGDSGAFENFRLSLQKSLVKLRQIDDEGKLKAALLDLQYELMNIQIREVEQGLQNLKTEVLGDVSLAAISLVTQLWSPQIAALGVLGAATKLVHDVTKATKKRRQHPAYFLWKLKEQGSLKR